MEREWRDDETVGTPQGLELILEDLPPRHRKAAMACLRPQVRTDRKRGRKSLCLSSIAKDYKANIEAINRAEIEQSKGISPEHIMKKFIKQAEVLKKIIQDAEKQMFIGVSLRHHFDTAGKSSTIRDWIDQAHVLLKEERGLGGGRRHALDGDDRLDPDRWLFRMLFALFEQRGIKVSHARPLAEAIRAWANERSLYQTLKEPKWGARALAEVRREWGMGRHKGK